VIRVVSGASAEIRAARTQAGASDADSHGHGFGQFSGRALGVANSRPIQGRTSSDLQTATLYLV